MARIAPFLVISIFGLCSQPVHAIWMRSASVEWWTSISDTVVVAEVTNTKKIEPLNQHWQSQEVTYTTTVNLKGQRTGDQNFRQDFRDGEGKHDDRKLRLKDMVLLFFAEDPERHKTKLIFWVNLSRPDANWAMTHAAYDNNCKWLGDGESVLALVKKRIDNANRLEKTKKRGVIVPFTAYEPGDMYWDFVRTADPDFKPVLIKELRDGDREAAIYNLVSYPGKDTADLIRPFLKDPATAKLLVLDGKDDDGNSVYKTVRFYPLRQAAYSALRLLGESPEQPEGFHDDFFLWLFEVGFERRAYFPYGDWKRFER